MSDPVVGSTLHIFVCRILEELGCERARASAIDILASIVRQFIINVGYESRCYSELANRSVSNARDVQLALHDFGLRSEALATFLSFYKESPPLLVVPDSSASSIRSANASIAVPQYDPFLDPSHSTPADFPKFLPLYPPSATYDFHDAPDHTKLNLASIKQVNQEKIAQSLTDLDRKRHGSSSVAAAGTASGAGSAGIHRNLYDVMASIPRRHDGHGSGTADIDPETLAASDWARIPAGLAPMIEPPAAKVPRQMLEQEVHAASIRSDDNVRAKKLQKYNEVMSSDKLIVAVREPGRIGRPPGSGNSAASLAKLEDMTDD
eukprot:ANDGO_06608.mRNA.1 hypothetical protein